MKAIQLTKEEKMFWANMPDAAAKTQAEYWSNKKFMFNKRELKFTKSEVSDLVKTQIAINTYFPQFNYLFLTK